MLVKDQERNEKMRAMRMAGSKLSEIGKAFGISVGQVCVICKGARVRNHRGVGVDGRKRPRNIERNAQIIEMYRSGMSVREIGKKINLTHAAVANITQGIFPLGFCPKKQKTHEEINRLHTSGMTVKQIADATGYSKEVVRNAIGMTGREFSQEQRFWGFVEIIPGGCWKWNGSKAPAGYGRMKWDGGPDYAHRISWMIHNGPIPAGMAIVQKCNNYECTNPEHLQIRAFKKLTADDVIMARELYGRGLASINDLSARFNVCYANMHNILTGKSWKHLLRQAARDVSRLD
jgi:hypothetical protein